LLGLRQPEHDPVVGPEHLGIRYARLLQLCEDRGRPWRVHSRAEGRQEADAPVADFVEIPLDDDRAVARYLAGGLALLVEVGAQVRRGAAVEPVVARQTLQRLALRGFRDGARELTDRAPELGRPTRPVAVPERHLSRLARSWRDEDAVVGDLVDAPRRRPEEEDLPRPRLEHHLFVEPADAPALPAFLAGEEHPVEAAVRDGARVDDGHPPRAFPAPNRAADPLPPH